MHVTLISFLGAAPTNASVTSTMDFNRKVIKDGTGSEKPKTGDGVTVEYTGYLYDIEVQGRTLEVESIFIS